MLLTITLTEPPATDLGFLLHKHPDRLQSFAVSAGEAHVFYPEAAEQRCTAALLLEIDPIGLVRGRRRAGSGSGAPEAFSLAEYVNDRPYAASSMLAVALGKVFRTAMTGRCDARPALAARALPLEISIPALSCHGGTDLAHRLLRPLGWDVQAHRLPLDPELPGWGDSRYLTVRLAGQVRLADALSHLYVLLPVLDDSKHYWVDDAEIDKLLRAGGDWLASHPERDLITHRYLAHQRKLAATAVARLAEVDDTEPEALDNAVPDAPDGAGPDAPDGAGPGAPGSGAPEAGPAIAGTAAPRSPLAQQRRDAVLSVLRDTVLRDSAAARVADLGCGEGSLVALLLREPSVARVLGVDVSHRALERTAQRLHLDTMPERQRDRVDLLQSSLTYADARLAGLDAAVLMEVIEHVDEPRLAALEQAVFGSARPGTVVVTTPNAEHNVRFADLRPGAMRHPDHRFEWTRAQFRAWADAVAAGAATRCISCPSARTTLRSARPPSWRCSPVPSLENTGPENADPGNIVPVSGTARRELGIPELSLVVLIGVSGSGKTTFARQHFGRYEVISSDFCRGLVADDENDQAATAEAFDVLTYIAGKRLAAGRLTVVDATNVQSAARRQFVDLARDHDVLPVAIVLDMPERLCAQRNSSRPDRTFASQVIHRQHDQLRRSLRGLNREGFRKIHVLRSPAQVEAAVVARERLLTDYRDRTGPFDVIGDVHGCRTELEALLAELGYRLTRDTSGRAVDAVPPEGRTAVFLGDLVDRGPDSPGVLRLVMGMVAAGHALAVPGNHENKLTRALSGRNVQVSHGLAETLSQLATEGEAFRKEVADFCQGLVSHLVLDGGHLVVAHAGLKQAYQGRASGRVRSFALYGDTTGETDEFGLPVRYPWAHDYRGRAMVLYGHTPTPEPEWVNNTMCLDTGCVFGGRLTALRYPEKEVVSVPAERVWYEPARPFAPAPAAGASGDTGADGPGSVIGADGGGRGAAQAASTPVRRDPGVLDITDVLGKRVIETAHHGRITVREENAAGALEVMSRFAVDPRWLLYLPPTMAPSPTSARPDLLEHPAEAFAAYRADGVTDVICEEKHMGSRAVLLACRDSGTARARFGVPDGMPGAVYTRTGRPLFGPDRRPAQGQSGPDRTPARGQSRPATARQLLDAVRAAVGAAGLWDELGTGWVLLDCEVMPWSVKAGDLLRHQYAAVGAAARAALPEAGRLLGEAAARGVNVAGLRRPDHGPRRQRGGVHRRLPALLLAGGRPGRATAGPVPVAGHRGCRPPRARS